MSKRRAVAHVSCWLSEMLFPILTFDRNCSELEARAGVLKEKEAKMFAYKRAVKGEKGGRFSVGLIACLAAE